MKTVRIYLVFASYRYDVDTPSSRLDQQVKISAPSAASVAYVLYKQPTADKVI